MQASHTKPLTEGARRPKRAIIFTRARVLPPGPAQESAQLTSQEDYCRQVARQLGVTVASVYQARGGAANAAVRALVEQLLAEVDSGGVDYVITSNLDRLARRPVDLARIAHRIQTAGARIATTADVRANFLQDVSLFCLIAKAQERRSA